MTQPPGMLPRPPRLFPADQLLSGQIRLDGYPFRHIAIHGQGHLGNAGVDVVLTAVEMLAPLGWDLINVTAHENLHYVAFLRMR
jgi:hypothetical protein